MACGGVLVQAVGAAQVRDQEDTGGTTLAEIDMTWDWQVFLSDDGSGRTYLQWMMDAWGWTLAVAGCSWVVAVSLGGIMGTLRTLPNSPWLVRLANVWVELFRNIPLLVQIFLWYFVVPKVIPAFQQVPGFVLVVFALGFFTSARIAEQVRARLSLIHI